MRLNAELESALSHIELQCEALSKAVNGGEPVAVEAVSQALRQGALEFANLLEAWGPRAVATAELRQRLHKVSEVLGIQRTGLIRRTAAVERTLHAVAPATRQTTYAKPAGFQGPGRQSGAFKAFAA
jgi:predicted amino acid-binding ACT domain protein